MDGSIWVSNRGDNAQVWDPVTQQWVAKGAVVKIGLVIGGERVNAAGEHDDDGAYLKPPFDYCNCEDRDNDGLIMTSRGLGDIMAWDNWDGADDGGAGPNSTGVQGAQDECILRYVRTAAVGARTVAIDRQNNVWVGGYEDPYARPHQRIDGFTGVPDTAFEVSCGGYGGFIVSTLMSGSVHEILWSARGGTGYGYYLLRWDTSAEPAPGQQLGACLNAAYGNYGLGFDGLTGHVWQSVADTGEGTSGSVVEIDPDDINNPAPHEHGDRRAQGVAVDSAGDVWVSHGYGPVVEQAGRTIGRLRNGTHIGDITLAASGPAPGPTGLAVDRNGMIWVTNYQDNSVQRINPAGSGSADTPISLEYPGETDPAHPYNYSDMTGMVGLHTTGTGTWTVVHDGTQPGQQWCQVHWNESGCVTAPGSEDLVVAVRAADRQTDLAAVPYTQVTYNAVQSEYAPLSGIVGRFIQVRVRFRGSIAGAAYASPSLCDLTVIPAAACRKGDLNFDGLADGRDIQPFVTLLLYPPTSIGPATLCAADTNYDGQVNLADIDCFVGLLLDHPCGEPCNGGGHDCNGNGVDDIADVISGTSQDCNKNWVPDECDIDPSDPDGNLAVSNDCNTNGIPDECELDCQPNGVPDECDIDPADPDGNGLVSADVDSNGIPDECEADCNGNGIPDGRDIANCPENNLSCHDCNGNLIPDGCEIDCNGNDIPDNCDIDPSDPDGDTIVWADCNQNGLPDACDLGWAPPRGSTDCNDNDIPDECDIANCPSNDPSCQDCNANGIPDACDIAAQISLDEDEDGIPDECEEGGRMGGEMLPGERLLGGDPAAYQAAWTAYWDWAREQTWGPNSPYTGAE